MFFKTKGKLNTIKSFTFWSWDKFFSNIRIALFLTSLIYICICIYNGQYWLDMMKIIQNGVSILDGIVLILFACPILYTISFLITSIYVKCKCKYHYSVIGYILSFSVDWNIEDIKRKLYIPYFAFTWDSKQKFYPHDAVMTRIRICFVMAIAIFIVMLMTMVILCGFLNLFIVVKTLF